MRWFKHFTDNHRGRSIQYLMDEMGHSGLCYFILMEMCAEKLERPSQSEVERESDGSLSADDCEFIFHRRVVESALRLRRAAVERLLSSCQTTNLFTYEIDGEFIKIKMPILLDLLDYDSKRSRSRRAKVGKKSRLDTDTDTDTEPDTYTESEEDTYLPPLREGVNLALIEPPPPIRLVQIWNDHCGELPKVKTVSSSRQKKIAAIWKRLDELHWVEVVQKLAASDFCKGKNDRGWRADFDFLIRPETFAKTLEGRYDNRKSFHSGMTDDGRFLTNSVKRAHNNALMIKKYLKNEGEENEKTQEFRNVEPNLSNG